MTTTDDLTARAGALLAAEAKMTPGPWRTGNVETFNVFVPCDDALAPELGRVLLRMNVHFPFDDDARGIVTLRNDAPAVIRDLLALLADQARPRCPMTCPHGDRCTLDRGHADGHNHRCPCNEPDTDPGAADVLAWIRARIAECRRVEAKYMAPRVSRQTRRGAAAVTGPEGMPQAVIEAVAERQALTTVAAMLADQARGLTVGAGEPRRPVAGWTTSRNGDETWWTIILAVGDGAEFYAIVKQYPDRPISWAVAVDPLDEDSAAWAEGTADDPDTAMLRCEAAAAKLLDEARGVLGRRS